MSKQTIKVQLDRTVPVDWSIFKLSAVGSETLVETDQGFVRASCLAPEHRLIEHGGSSVDIEWVDRRDFSADDLRAYPDLNPVVIPAGQFGFGIPRRNTILSPNQMIWAERQGGIHLAFGSARRLAPEPFKLRNQGIPVSYVVLVCSRPAMFNAEGMWLPC